MGDTNVVPTRTRWARLRLSIIGHLFASPPAPGELGKELATLAARTWTHPVTSAPVRFGFSTIERWYHAAKAAHDPMGALARRPHKQRGKHPGVGPKVRAELGVLYAGHASWSRRLLYDNLAAVAAERSELGPLPSYATVCRYLRDAGLEKKRRPRPERPGEAAAARAAEERETRSYEASHVHGLWHADFHDGSRKVLVETGAWIVPQLFAVIDDRARLVCHAQWYAHEGAREYVHGLSQALSKRGLPRELMSDNGSAMRAAETRTGLERLGIQWAPTLEYSPEQNGKIEVFWTPIEGRLLPMLDDVRELTLERLNTATLAWVELEYNREVHRETSETPLARFLAGPSVARDCPSSDGLRDAFRRRVERTVRRSDGTLTVDGIRYELPSRYRHLTKVGVLYAEWDMRRVDMVDARSDTPLCRLVPIDKAKNAEGHRRRHEPIAGGEPAPRAPEPEDQEAPLLRKLLAEYAATGLPPAYVSAERWLDEPSHDPHDVVDENGDDLFQDDDSQREEEGDEQP